MRFIQLLGCLLVLASCRPITNQVNRLELQCGPSDASGLVKVLSASGSELEDRDMTIFRRDGETFQSVTPTTKGCFAYDPLHDYIIHSKDNQGLVVPAGQDLRLVALRDVQTSDLSISCPTQAVTKDFDLRASLNNSGELDGFALDVRITDSGSLALTQKAALVSRQDYSLQLFRDLPDGIYTLEIRTQNLLKNQRPRSQRCDIQIDSAAPEIAIDSGSFLPRMNQGFTLIEPTARIRFQTRDASRTEILSCWVSQEESMLSPIPTGSCSLKPMGSEISPPAEGYWILSYQALDEAGQRSPLQQQAFLVYQGGTLREISLEMELTQFLFDNNQNLRAVQKTLAAETQRRRLPTAFERQEMMPVVEANLYQMSPRKIPYLEKKYAALRLVTMTPDGTRAVVNQVEPENILIALDSVTGQELWRAEHPNGRAIRLAYTADSKRLITSGTLSGELLIWSVETGALLKRIPRPNREGFENKVFEIFLAGNDRYIGAAGFDDSLYIYDLEADEPKLIAAKSYDKWLLSFSWSPSGERFVTTEGKNAHVYSRDGTLIQTVTREDSVYISAAAFLSEDELVLASVEKTDRENRKKFKCGFFYARLGQDALRLASYDGNIDKILPSPDRKHFVAIGSGSNGAALFTNFREKLNDPARVPTEDFKYETLNGGASTDGAYWTLDSRVFATTAGENAADSYARVQDVDGGLYLELGPGARNFYVADQGQRLLNYTVDGRLEFWNLKQAPIDRFVLPQRVQVTKFSQDGSRLLTIEERGTDQKLIRVWDRSSLKELRQASTTAAFINTLLCTAFSGNQELIMPLDQHRIQRLDLQTGTAKMLVDRSDADLIQQRGAIIAFAMSQDGQRMALGYALGFLEIIDLQEEKSLYLARLHTQSSFLGNADMFGEAVSSVGFRGASYDVVTSGQDGQLILSSPQAADGYSSRLLFQFPEVIFHIDVEEKYVAVAPRLNSIVVYEIASGSLLALPIDDIFPAMIDLNVQANVVSAVSFAGDLYTWNLAEGERRHRIVLKRGVQEVRALSLSADGQELLTAVQGEVLLIPNSSERLYERFCRYLSAMQICPSMELR